jgi:hypothetical protein
MPPKKTIAKWSLGALALALLVIQLLPVQRTNPPVEAEVTAPSEVMAVLRRSCYDCHSHETAWPWYSYVAPLSWLVAHDVEEGREKINFSTWGRLSDGKRNHALEEIWEEVEEGEMPLWAYTLAHRGTSLSQQDLALLRDWTAPARRERSGRSGRDGGHDREHEDEGH